MSTPEFQQPHDLTEFRKRLLTIGYSPQTLRGYVPSVRNFLQYLDDRGVALDTVDTSHLIAYREHRLRQYRRVHGRAPACMRQWRSDCNGGINHFLKAAIGLWPRLPAPRSPDEALARSLLAAYHEYLMTYTALAPSTIEVLVYDSQRFITWCQERRVLCNGADLSLRDVDAYVQLRASRQRRSTSRTMVKHLEHFLRFLHQTGRVPEDLSRRLVAPTLYQYESIPSILEADQIAAVLQCTRRDRSPKGRRDYAMLAVLATYGLRGGEVARLRLDDVDWRAETLTVLHTKTRTRTTLPLLPHVGEALLGYLRHGRPKVVSRELFIRMKAPFVGLKGAKGVRPVVEGRLAAAGVRLAGRSGSRLFRHARAVTLLRERVPVKTIADLLGHRSPRSTTVYLKLQSDELRTVALPLPSVAGGAR
jgi:integrase/recombinase XerD